MKTYEVLVDFSGYVRGTKIYKVKANSEEEAKRLYRTGEELSSDIERSDLTEGKAFDARLQE